MSIIASHPARDKNPTGVRPKSAKSARVIIASVFALTSLTACGDISNWWHQDKIPNPNAIGGAAVQSASIDSGSGGVAQIAEKNDESAQAASATNTTSETSATTVTSTATPTSAAATTDAAATTSATAPSNTAAATSATAPANTAATTSATAPIEPVLTTETASTTTAANPGSSTVSLAEGSSGDYRPAGYDTLFFGDEFNGTELDRSKWCTRYVWGGGPALQVPDDECTKFPGMGVLDYANADEQQRYRDFNNQGEPLHVLNNGVLELRATKTGTDWYLQYEAAMLNSKITFKPEGQTSYYITTRMRLPNVLGTWPSIWLAPSLSESGEAQWPPEIDIFEGPLNNNPETEFTLHQHSQVRGNQTDSGKYEFFYADENFDTTWGYYTSPDRTLRDVWIEIAAEWTVDGVCFYIDGFNTACENYRWVANDGAPGNPANLILNLAVGGPWAGRSGIDEASFPTQLEVDYVRVYRRN